MEKLRHAGFVVGAALAVITKQCGCVTVYSLPVVVLHVTLAAFPCLNVPE
jgi:hypothetical protein